MTFEQVKKIFKIEIEKEEATLASSIVGTLVTYRIPTLNMKGSIVYNGITILHFASMGVSLDSIIAQHIVQQTELEKWLGEKIQID
jgi:hypothetical protein